MAECVAVPQVRDAHGRTVDVVVVVGVVRIRRTLMPSKGVRHAVLWTDANGVASITSHRAARPLRHHLDEAERVQEGLTHEQWWERVAQKGAPLLHGRGHMRLRERARARCQ